MPDTPFEMTFVILVGLSALALGLIVLVFMLLNRGRRLFLKFRYQQVPYISVPQHVFRFVLTFFWIGLSLIILFIGAFVQSFQSFNKEELVALIQCHAVDKNAKTMLLEVEPVRDGELQDGTSFLVHGDQWALEGDILKWDSWLNFGGLHTMYKLTRVRGRYVETEDERSGKNSVYSLVPTEDDPQWRWLYHYGYRLRFVDAVYGNTVFTYPDEGKLFQVFVTTSGFIVRASDKM